MKAQAARAPTMEREDLLEHVRDCTGWRIERRGDALQEPQAMREIAERIEAMVVPGPAATRGAAASSSQMTFENVDEAPITVADYLWIFWVVCTERGVDPSVWQHVYIYLRRFVASGVVRATPCAVHRLILVAVVVALKACEDRCRFTNAFLAELGDVSLRNLNRMERIFLAAVDFNLYVSPAEHARVGVSLQQRALAPPAGSSHEDLLTGRSHTLCGNDSFASASTDTASCDTAGTASPCGVPRASAIGGLPYAGRSASVISSVSSRTSASLPTLAEYSLGDYPAALQVQKKVGLLKRVRMSLKRVGGGRS